METERTVAATTFEDLYRDCAQDLYAYAMTLLRERAAAEDVTQAAFERAFRKFSTFDARRGSARAWLFGIARNAALDELRKRKRTATLVGDVADDERDDGDRDEEIVRRATVRTALAQISPRERELIALKFYAGFDNAEIASVLGVSESNAGTRLHRAVTRLREACNA